MFDKADGTHAQLARDCVPMLVNGGGPKLHLYRAAHRNDDNWAETDWLKYGVDELKRKVLYLGPSLSRRRRPARNRDPAGRPQRLVRDARANYTVYGMVPSPSTTAVTPKARTSRWPGLGVRDPFDKRLDRSPIRRGPENRRPQTGLGRGPLYSSTVRQQITPYAKPMEAATTRTCAGQALSGGGARPAWLPTAISSPTQARAPQLPEAGPQRPRQAQPRWPGWLGEVDRVLSRSFPSLRRCRAGLRPA